MTWLSGLEAPTLLQQKKKESGPLVWIFSSYSPVVTQVTP